MKVTFPHLGNAYISLEALLQGLGHDPVTPPLSSKKTLDWGSRHSPEETCLPFKILLGNMLEGLEKGADSVFMIGGWGPCRLGYYAQIQKQILQGLGKEVEFITIEAPAGNYSQAWQRAQKIFRSVKIRSFLDGCQLAWAKLKALEQMEVFSLQARPREKKKGSTSRLLAEQLKSLRGAQQMRQIERVLGQSRQGFLDLMANPSSSERVLRVGLLGEIYTVVEPFANLGLEERLGHLGVEVIRTISLRAWVWDHVFKTACGINIQRKLQRSASGYLRGFVGGHGLESIARSVDLARSGVAGIIHILPLSCMPEIVAQSILPQISRDGKIPILSLVVDEHSGETGFQTRLEAFVDLLSRRGLGYAGKE